jgi:phosphatidylserine decarboxylase
VKEGHHQVLQVEVFRRKPKSEERVLIGEAQVSAAFLLGTSENHVIIEAMRGEGQVAATVLLKLEKCDHRGRTTSSQSSPAASVSFTEEAGYCGLHEHALVSSASSNFSKVNVCLCIGAMHPEVGAFSASSGAVSANTSDLNSPHKSDFLQKFTLSGSPVVILKSDFAGPMPSISDVELPARLAISNKRKIEGEETESLMVDMNEDARSSSSTSQVEEQLLEVSRRSPMDVKGLVSLEVVAAQNLPRERRMLRVHYQNNPFVVISFGKQSFKTKVIKKTVNPVWKERLFFTVKESEASYYVMFSVYDYDKLSYNSCIGATSLKASTLLEHPNEIQKLALPLRLANPNGFSDACILVKACFISYDMLRKNFWEVLAKQYDHDDNGKLNRIELTTMLESIGSTLSEASLDEILRKLDVDADGEIDIGNIVSSLEDLTVRSQQSDHPEENIVLVKTCPICDTHFTQNRDDIDVITHLAICAAKDSGSLDRFVMGGFITEDYASRKWFMKLLSFMSFGGYRIGKNNGNILVQDRRTGKLLEEKMPTYIRLGIRWMHQYSASSRAVDSYTVRQIFQNLTLKQGRKYDDPASVKNIPDFVKYHKLNVDEILEPLDSFRTFNEFFYRKLKPGVRRVASPDPQVCVSPADCRVNCFASVDEATKLWIKGANFSLAGLLKDESLADYYKGGSLVVCRLAPQDYHRFHSPVDGQLSFYYHIPGTYFTVNPMAVRQRIDVYTENARTVCLIESEQFGKVAFVAVGAMMVGSIVITATGGDRLKRMDELGYFAFGGSTIVVVFPPDKIAFDEDLLRNSREPLETLVQVGDSFGQAILKDVEPTAGSF